MGCIFEYCGWPLFWEEDVADRQPVLLVYDGRPPSPYLVEKIQFQRFELNLEALDKRYAGGDAKVREEHRVQVTYALGKKSKLAQKLTNLANHPSTTKAEADNAKKRLEKLTRTVKNLVAESHPELERRRHIDRKQLFMDNLFVVFEGRCGYPQKMSAPWRKVYYVYARTYREIYETLNLLHEVTDNYVAIPKRLKSAV